MLINFSSDCTGTATNRTRRVLDRYLVRVSQRVWMGPMTQESLQACLAALRAKASKNTAISCFKVFNRRRFVLVSQIGAKRGFNSKGAYHVGSTKKVDKKEERTQTWRSTLKMMARMAGFAHDLGKANKQFQAKIRGKTKNKGDAIRHEWLSLKITQLLLKGLSWEEAWQTIRDGFDNPNSWAFELSLSEENLSREARKTLFNKPIDAVMYSILTHHGLLESEEEKAVAYTPTPSGRHIKEQRREEFGEALRLFEEHYKPTVIPQIIKLAKRIENHAKLHQLSPQAIRGMATLARTALIFSDFEVSSRLVAMGSKPQKTKTYANSTRRVFEARNQEQDEESEGQERGLNQTLDYHLEEVGILADRFCDEMLGLQDSLPSISTEVIDEVLTPALPNSPYSWQDRAREFVEQRKNKQTPALVLNIAETGAGKTISNLKLAVTCNPENPRVSFAYNLQTLTLQSGSEYKKIFKEHETEVSVVVGDKGVRALFELGQQDGLDEDGNAPTEEFEAVGEPPVRTPELLQRMFPDGSTDSKILNSPCLVSTIDYLINAGEPFQQGNHVKSMLRVMSSDLILDEVDSFDARGLVAVCRLIEATALCGRSVICSSATVSPSLARHLIDAFASGAAMRSAMGVGDPDRSFDFFCVDNYDVGSVHFSANAHIEQSATLATQAYEEHIEKVREKIAEKEVKKKAKIFPSSWVLAGKNRDFEAFKQIGRRTYYEEVGAQVERFHKELRWNCAGKMVSFGLIRMANIKSAIQVAEYLAIDERNKVCVYHSEEMRYVRSKKEKYLDLLLNRKAPNYAEFLSGQEEITKHFGQYPDVRFIVVATPVEEAGKDHDFDWGIIDPSSTGSLIQTAGRINRHRRETAKVHNIAILQYNFRACKNLEGNEGESKKIVDKLKKPAFIRPGNEPETGQGYPSKSMSTLFVKPEEDWSDFPLDARRRFDPEIKLTDLDDASIRAKVSPYFSEEGIFNKGHCTLLSRKTYSEMTLRDTEQSFKLRLAQVGDDLHFEMQKAVKHKYGYAFTWERKKLEILREKSGFLSWSPLDLLAECREKVGTNLMLASLRIYGDASEEVSDVFRAYCPWRGFLRN